MDMTQRRHFMNVAAAVIVAIAVIVTLRIWWQVESPVPRATQPVQAGGTGMPLSPDDSPKPRDDTPPPPAGMPPERSAPDNAAGLSISGCVRDTFGNPVRGAVVACAGEDGREARSDREGLYRIDHLPDRIFALTATHPAYFSEQNPLVLAGTDSADFALSIRASLEVEAVRSDTREPLPCYFVNFRHTADAPRSAAGTAGKGGFGAKAQDPAGKIAISLLEAVPGVLRVWQEGYDEQTIAISAQELANTPHRVLVALEPSRDGLEGVVVNTGGEPVAGAYVLKGRMSWADDVPRKAEMQTGPDGRFRLDPVEDPWAHIIAWHPDYAPAYIDIDPDTSPRELLRIVLHGTATVRGRVTLDGEPLEKCHVVAFFKGEKALDENGKHTAADGTYELRGLPPGLAHVEARVDAKAWGGNGVHIAQTAELVEGEVTPVDFALERPAATLEGRIRVESVALEDAEVVLALETGQGAVQYSVDAECDGTGEAYYRIESVLPGDGMLTVMAGSESELFFRLAHQKVAIPPGANVVRDITISAPCGVAGNVVSRKDFDIVGLLVFEGESSMTGYDIVMGVATDERELAGMAALTVVSGGIFGSGKENPAGEYAVQALEPGRYTVVAIGLTNERVSSDRAFVTLRDGETQTVNLELREYDSR